MTFSTGFLLSEAQQLLKLSALTYVDQTPNEGETVDQQQTRMKNDIDSALKSGPNSLPGWQVAWGPALSPDHGNMLFIAGNAALNQYALAVRGTDWKFIMDWVQDLSSFLLLPYPAANAGKIASGTLEGLETLKRLKFLDFIATLPADAGVYVTGHSLGGCLASVVAPLIAAQRGGTGNVKVYTFAAPSPGDAEFKNYFTGLFGDDKFAFRVYNTLDVVPNAWASLATVKTYYAGFCPCTQEIKNVMDVAIKAVGNKYATVGTDHPLTGQIISPLGGAAIGATINPIGDAIFGWEAGQQHATDNYLSLLGAQPPTTGSGGIMGIIKKLLSVLGF